MSLRVSMTICIVILMTACTTRFDTNIVTDRVISPSEKIEPLGLVSAAVSTGRLLWPQPADRELYEEVRQEALKLRDGNLLINAKITTTLTSYLGLYYRTMLKIDGAAARVVESRPGEEDGR